MERFREFAISRRVRYGIVAVYAGCVLVASVIDPPSGSLDAAGPLGLVGFDTWIHVLAYSILGAGVAVALGSRRRRAALVAVLVATAFGVGIEFVQTTLPARSFDPLDMVANGLGAIVGVACWRLGRSLLERPTDR